MSAQDGSGRPFHPEGGSVDVLDPSGLPEKRLLVTGDRTWRDRETIQRGIEDEMPMAVLIHGGARGADWLAGDVAEDLGIPTLVFPAQWRWYGRAAGVIRNQAMLDEAKPTHVLAFHPFLPRSKGTADMIRRARRAGLPVRIISGKDPVTGAPVVWTG